MAKLKDKTQYTNRQPAKVQKEAVKIDVEEPTGQEDAQFNSLKRHYDDAYSDTDQRAMRDGGFDDVDKMFRTYLDPNTWPYQALIADPRTFTFIIEKGSRMIANKLRGRLEPREGGDVIGAQINNELLSFQWDNANHNGTMLSKWAMMDQLTRKYGSGFALCKWRYEVDANGKTIFDGPEMRVLNNRDAGPDPSSTCVENMNWFQYRDYPTFDSLERVNDAAQTKPVYKNLDKLREAIAREETKNKGGNRRDNNWKSVNKSLLGLNDTIGDDRVFKTVEVVTEYRRDRWITFAPKYGIVLRDIPNPYDNNELPVVMLRYYAVDDDLYGLSEVEPVMKLFKAINAFTSHAVDEANQKLYSPLKVRSTGVRMHTINFDMGAKWIMNDPTSDVVPYESSSNNLAQFTQIYSALVAASQEALGESSLGVSNVGPFQDDKTATEVRSLTQEKKARDNFNQIFLQEAIERQMMLWHGMNQKFLLNKTSKRGYVLRVVGKDAIEFFQKQGFDAQGLTDEAAQLMGDNPAMDVNELTTPLWPVPEGDFGQETKFQLDATGQSGTLIVEPEDLNGNYDYIADVESMALGAAENEKQGRDAAMTTILSNQTVLAYLQMEGVKPKFKEMLVDWLEDKGFKDADKYFETVQEGGMNAPNQGGAPGATAGLPVGGNVPNAGMAEAQGVPGQQNPAGLRGPTGF